MAESVGMKRRYRARERERLVAVLTKGAPIKDAAEQLGVKVTWKKR